MSRPKSPIGRMTELDLLRFLAAFCVLAFHYTSSDGRMWGENAIKVFPAAAPIFRFGSMGVVLFFCISGFVILMSAWDRSVEEFAVSRITRLFPAYWFAIALVATVSLLTGKPDSVNLRVPEFLTNLTMVQEGLGVPHALPVFWTLWIELRFYLLIALLIAVGGMTYKRVMAFMAGWLLLSAVLYNSGAHLVDQFFLFMWSPYFVGGMAAFLIRRFGSSLLPWLIFGFSWLLALHTRGTVWAYPGMPLDNAAQSIEAVLTTVIFGVMALVAVGALRFLRWKRLTVLGALTYPIYLIHHWCGELVITTLGLRSNPWLGVAASLTVALVLAYGIYRLVEVPVQRVLRSRLKDSLRLMREASAPAEPPPQPPSQDREPASLSR
ncbi:MAG: acyltransferase 3 [Actinomycetia bacterium]|nr:acyltransferase 3 [Actinomycetes bacterium]